MTVAPGVGVLTTDRTLHVRSWNPWLADATGLAEQRVLGTPLAELAGGSTSTWQLGVFEEVLGTGTPRVLAPAFHRYLIPCPPREPSPHFERMQQRVTVAPLRRDDEVLGLIITIEDVTRRVEAERELAAELQRRPDGAVARAGVTAANWKLRRASVETLKRVASREDIEYLIETLARDHHDINVLSSALQVLTAADVDVTPALTALLTAPDPNLRMHAALAVGQLHSDTAVPALVAALDDPDQNVRFHVIEALGRIGAPEAVEPLADIAASGDFYLAFAAIDALARTQDARVAGRLVGLLAEEELRPAVIDSLAVLGDEDCVPQLAALLNADVETPRVAAALDRVHGRYEEAYGAGAHIADLAAAAIQPPGIHALGTALSRRQAPLKSLVVVLGWMGTHALPALLEVLGDQDVQASVDAAVLATGKAAVEPLLRRLETGSRQERLAAASLLGRLGDRRAVLPLMALLASADAEMATTAAGALTCLGDPRALDELLALFGHPRAAVRQAAIGAVHAISAPETRSRIRTRLTDGDPRVRECAIRVAGYFGFEDAVPAIFGSLGDEDEAVRRAAIEQLPLLADPRAVPKLAEALAGETPRNRAAAAHALGLVDAPAAGPALTDALADPDPWVRYFAAGSVSRLRLLEAVPALVERAQHDPATHVRIAALQALGALDAPHLSDLASELIRDADADLAAAALSSLARVSDPRVDHLLETAARSSNLVCRVPAVQALANRHTGEAAEVLAWAARTAEPPDLPAVAIEGLRRIGAAGEDATSVGAVAALVGLAAEVATREAALAALASLPETAIPALAAALRAPRVVTRLAAVEALARMRHPRASQALADGLRDDDADVRGATVAAFGRLGTPAASAVIAQMQQGDPDPGVRRRAEAVCRRHGWPKDPA